MQPNYKLRMKRSKTIDFGFIMGKNDPTKT